MIARLKGLVEAAGEDHAVIDVHGVGYLVFCGARTLARLPAQGEAVALFVETQVREDQIALYGFLEAAEREWFRRLTTVQGVGARVALAILGVNSADELSRAVAAGDRVPLTRASGVGPRLANRILSELKGVVVEPTPAAAGGASPPAAGDGTPEAGVAPGEEAVSALVNLGYGRSDAHGAVARVRTADPEQGTEGLIRAALRELAPRE